MEARPEETQNLESFAKHTASFRERKEQHGNIGKGRVEATFHSKGRDLGQEITSLVFLFLIFSGHGLIFTLFLNIYDHHFLNYVAGIISFLPLLYIWS